MGFPDGSDGKESAGNSGDLVSIPGQRKSPGEGNGYPRIFQYPRLEKSMDFTHVCMAVSLPCSLRTITAVFGNQLHPSTKYKV